MAGPSPTQPDTSWQTGATTVYKVPSIKISQCALLAISWALFGFTIAFFIARLVVRAKYYNNLYYDDGILFAAVIFLLSNLIVVTIMSDDMCMILRVTAGLEMPDILTIMPRSTFYLKCQFASTVLFWCNVWAVKASFLAFFRRLVKGVRKAEWAWWFTVAVTAAGFVVAVITCRISCTSFIAGEFAYT